MKLILLRHAHARHAGPDAARPLTEAGRAEAARLGDWLRARGHVPTRALCSDARRTRETFEALALDLAPDLRPDLYGASAEVIATLARPAPGETLLIVAHNPGIAEAAHRAVARRPDHPRFAAFPPASCLVLDAADGTCLDFAVGGEV